MRLLLVEDDRRLAQAVKTGLEHSGWAVDTSATAAQAQTTLASCRYDGIVMEFGLPDMEGRALLQRLRKGGFIGALIVVCQRADAQHATQLLDLGADDCIIKPLDLHELAARLRAIARRGGMQGEQPAAELRFGSLCLQPATRTVTFNGEPVALTNKEFWLLEALLRKKNQVVSRSQLEETLYGWDDDVDSNTVEVYVHHLRRKFGAELIQTVRGSGYCIGQAG
jgi:DNA-binding response OmpR family regulator